MTLRAALLALVLAGPAAAQDGVLTGTLRTVQERGTLRIGARESAVPFSFLNRGNQSVGFSIDLCRGIAEDVAAAVNRPLLPDGAAAWEQGLRIEYVPVSAAARFDMVASGAIDLECGSSTATAERERTVAFSPVFFLAGTKLLVPGGSPLANPADLAGKRVIVSAGTTNGAVLRRLAARPPGFAVLDAPDVPAAFRTLAAGGADALASDDILLAGLLTTEPAARGFRIVGDYLSFEPYAIAFRRDDAALTDLIRSSFARMAQSGMLNASYDRWFTGRLPDGSTMNLPMSAYLAQMYRAMGSPD